MMDAIQLKALIKDISNEKKISSQLVLQNYMLERFLERIAMSEYQRNFVIKGGFLIASMVGLDSRAPMDMDITITRHRVDEDDVHKMVREIADIQLEDGISFNLRSIGKIREGNEYTGYRVSLLGNYPPMAVPIKVDITTGERIAPSEVEYEYSLMTEDRNIHVLACNMDTILAEKLEVVISRGDQNANLRDYYDIYILTNLHMDRVDVENLAMTLIAISKQRESLALMKQYEDIIENVRMSQVMNHHWHNYMKDFNYAEGVTFSAVCDSVVDLMRFVEGYFDV